MTKKRWHQLLRSERQGPLDLPGAEPLSAAAEKARRTANEFILNLYSFQPDWRAIEIIAAESSTQFFCIEGEVIRLSSANLHGLPQMPPAYGYKGGAARYLLNRAIRPTAAISFPRDLDLLRFGKVWTDRDTELSKQFMTDDFERGWGVELSPGIDEYLHSRDISINEVLYIDGQIICSVFCFLDSLAYLLRPCFYRPGTLQREPAFRGRVFLKLLRLYAEGTNSGEPWAVMGDPGDFAITDFDFALELDKAFSRGSAAGERFFEVCRAAALLEEEENKLSLVEFLSGLCPGLYGGTAFFRHLPGEIRARIRSGHAGGE